MRYEDTSGAIQASGPVANDDSDTLAAGSRGPATGNLITGEGTQYGSAGADTAVGAHVTAIAGKGGEDASFAAGKLSVTGEFGQLSVDAEGNYSYLANKGAPENVRDRFTYTLADNQGNSDTAALIVEIGKTPVVIKADAQQVVPGPDGVVTLPPGVELSDIMVVGRNLVVNMPDGTQLIIVDGAVFVPQLSLGGVEIPATNVAALLIGQEPQPAAGETPPSSGGNFALPPPPLDPGVPLGDLLPPTEYDYIPPEPQEDIVPEDEEPEVLIQPDDQPASVAAVDDVNERGLPERDGDELGEPAGSGEIADGDGTNNSDGREATAGRIIINADDGVGSITINGELVTGDIGQEIEGEHGTLTITGFDGDDILYSYLLHDNTDGDNTSDDFDVVLTDEDGDVASATLHIDIIDDVPTARPDTDALGVGEFIATGNVMTDSAPGDADDSDTNAADTVGADNAGVTSISGAGGSDSTFEEGSLTVEGQYGVLTMQADGSYIYVRNQDAPGGVEDVFNYTLTDGDGDTSTTTLTITIPDTPIAVPFSIGITFDDDAQPGGNPGGVGDVSPDLSFFSDTINASGGDGALTFTLRDTGAPAGFTYVLENGDLLIKQGGDTVIVVTLDAATGTYTITQVAPIDHPAGLDENTISFNITVRVTDADGDFVEGTGTLFVNDDTPIAIEGRVTGTVDEDGVVEGTADGGAGDGIAGGVGDVPGAATVASGSVAAMFSAGADVPLTYGFAANAVAVLEGLGLTSNGVALDYEIVGNVVTASTAAGDVFTFELNADGSWEFTLIDQLDHAEGNNENDLTINLGNIVEATDNDGDSVVGNANGLVITVDDDTPTASEDQVTGLVDEDGVVEGAADGGEGDGIAGGVGDVAGAPTVASGSVAAMFNTGADAPLSYGFAANAVAVLEALGLTSNGVSLDYAIVGNTVTASTAAGDVFTFELNADGSWEFTLIDQLDHADGGNENDLTINLGNIIEATDADGDSVVGAADGLVITVDDDTPTASANQVTGAVDEDGVVEGADDGGEGDGIAGGVGDVAGEDTVATGSVVTMFNSGADAPLSYGFATNAVAVLEALGLTSNGVALDYAIVGNTVTASTAAGDVFTFELNADGSWEFTLIDQLDHADGANENDLTINLGAIVEATDADGDSVVGNANGLVITVDDDTPTASANQVTGTVDEDGVLEGTDDGGAGDGIAGGVGDVAGENTVASGSVAAMFNSGADAPLSYGFAANAIAVLEALNLSSNGVALDYAIVGNTVTASTAAGEVFTFELNADGSWEFTLIDQLDHADGGDENNLAINLGGIIEATDADGDSVVGAANGLVITVDDDTPTASQNQVTGLVDEDGVVEGAADGGDGDGIAGGVGDVPGAPTVASGSVATMFNSGADAPLSYGFAANAVAVLEGLGLTSNGVALDYEIVGNTVTASTAAGEVFTFELNDDGSWEFTLIDQLDHAEGNNENDLTINLGAIVEATDADGDSVVGNATGLVITVDDDTPTASANQVTGTVDEDGVLEGAANNGPGDGIPGGLGDVAGTDTTATGSVVTMFNSGADAPLSYGFAANAIAVLEGLNLTSGGVALDYEINGDIITASTAAGDVFTFELNSNGNWEFTLIDQLDHPTLDGLPGDDTENDLTINLGAIVEATDADGDSVVGAANGLVITVDDDTPLANDDTDSVVGGFDPATGNVITGQEVAVGEDANGTDGVADRTGADEPASITLIDHPDSDAEVVPNGGSVTIEGTYGELTIYSNGDYSYQRDLGTPGGVEDVFTYTLTDADGDSVTATLTIGIDDNFPTAGNVEVQLDDDDVAGLNGNPDGTGDDDPSGTSGLLPGSGGDAPLTFSLLATGAPAGFTYQLQPDGSLHVLQGGNHVVTIEITNTATGAYTVTQVDNIIHPDGLNENNVDFTVNYRVTDNDNDFDDGTIHIDIDDDTPVTTATLLTGTVDEDGVLEGAADNGPGDGIAGGTGDVAGQNVVASGNVSTLFSAGADGPLTFDFAANAIAVLEALNLSSGGVDLEYAIVGDIITASTPAGDVFTFELNSNGDWEFTLIDQLDHANGNAENDLTIALGGVIEATDVDNDSVVAPANGLVITVDDDTPIATAGLSAGTVDEDGVVEGAADAGPGDGIAGGTGDVGGQAVVATGSASVMFQSGADQPLTFSFAANAVATLEALNLTSGGVALDYEIVGDVVTASTAAGDVFTFELSDNGDWEFTLIDQLDHANANAENDLTISLGAIVQATDFDGDSVVGNANGLVITVDDDSPTLGEIQDQVASNVPGDPVSTGTLHFEVGADEPATVVSITADNTGITSGGKNLVTNVVGNVLTAYQDANGSGTYDAGDTVAVYTLTVNPNAGTSGQYTFDLLTALDPTITNVPIGGSSSFGAGPTLGQILEDAGGTDLSVVSGYTTTAGFNFNTWLDGGLTSAMVASAGVNGSTSGWGVEDNNFGNTDEIFFFDFGDETLSNPDGAGMPGNNFVPPATTLPQISIAEFDFINYNGGAGNAGDDIAFVVHLVDASGNPVDVVSGFVPDSVLDGSSHDAATNWVFTAPAGTFIGDIQFYSGANPDGSAQDLQPGKIDLVSVGVQTSDLDETIDFTVTLSDFDGDQVSGGFSVNVMDGGSPVTPEALMSTLSMGGGDTSFSNLSFSNDNGKWGGHGNDKGFSSINNTGIVAGMVAAAGLQSTAVAGSPSIESSFDVGLQDLAQTVGLPAYQLQSIGGDSLNVQTFGLEGSEPAFDVSALQGTGHNFSDFVSDGGLDIQSYTDAASGYQPNFQVNQAPAVDASMLAATVAPAVGIPSAEALIAAGVAGVQQGGSVEQILADALGNQAPTVDGLLEAVNGGGEAISPTIEAALLALPGGGGAGDLSAVLIGASPDIGSVSSWDMSMPGSIGAGFDMVFKMDVATLHQDAVQPTVNG